MGSHFAIGAGIKTGVISTIAITVESVAGGLVWGMKALIGTTIRAVVDLSRQNVVTGLIPTIDLSHYYFPVVLCFLGRSTTNHNLWQKLTTIGHGWQLESDVHRTQRQWRRGIGRTQLRHIPDH